jgi:hypothetical protein
LVGLTGIRADECAAITVSNDDVAYSWRRPRNFDVNHLGGTNRSTSHTDANSSLSGSG